MPELDDSIGHLRAFISTLQSAKAKVEEAAAAVDEHAGDLGRLEGTAGEGIGEFVDALETLANALQESEAETVGQLDRVAAEAEQTAGERLGALGRTLDDDEAEFENTVQVGRDDLDKDAAALATNGFQFLVSSLETLQGEVVTARQAAESSFQTFEDAVQGLQQDAETGFDGGAQAFDAAVAAFGDEGTRVATQAADSESELQVRASELQTECDGLRDGATTSYGGYMDAVESASQDLVESVRTLGEDTAAFVTSSSADQIDAPVALVMADTMPPFVDELELLDAMLVEGDQTTAETDALCSELERCQRAVETIDQMLNAME
jgi:hypothetical protein